MASVELKLNVTAQGMPGLVKQSEQFNKNMQSGATAGGTAGSKQAAAKASYAAAKSENNDYNVARGLGSGSTGSASSDFARQASGLGGLVHLYATFAANIFAVSAAFNALSKSMDIVNLVDGLDQIGAASGKNLGSVAKQMVAVADGAISLRDAMTSTAQASAGGISNANILRMTQVAKQASLALGRDLPDSMDRITKGIIKIQPELLDELGIMTRVIPAQQAYALQMGKTASQLTDFEKRQAFANAVLAEGEKKFGSINLQANPYSKLLASSTNLLQSGLEVINKVLSPLISLLASSPTGLALAIGGIGAMLLKQAIPALGAWRQGLREAALESEKTANRINSNFMDYDIARRLGPAQKESSAAAAVANDAISKVQTSLGKAFSKNSKLVKAAMSSNYDPESNQENIDKQVKASATKLKTLEEARKITTNTDKTHLDSLDAAITKQKEQLGFVKQAAAENVIASQKMADSRKILDDAVDKVGADPKKFSEAWQREQIAKRASMKASSSMILSNVGSNTESMGVKDAFKALFSDVKNGAAKLDDAGKATGQFTDKLSGLTKYTTLAKGSFGILTSAISTGLNAFGPWIAAIGIAAAAISAFDSYMTSSAKEAGAYSGALEALSSSTANVGRTMDVIAAKDPLERLSINSIQAIATALQDLSDSSKTVLASFNKLQDTMNGWDKKKDAIYSFFGGGIVNNLAESLSVSISESVKLVDSGPQAKIFKDRLSKLLKIDKFDADSLKKALPKLSPSDLKELQKSLSDINTEYNNSASRLTAYKEVMESAVKTSKELSNTFALTDSTAKLGTGLLAVSGALQNLLGSEEEAKTALLDLMQDTSKMVLLGEDYALKLVGIREEYISNTAAVREYSDKLKTLAEEQAKLKEVQDNAGPSYAKPGWSLSSGDKADASAAMADKNRQLLNTLNRLDDTQIKASSNIISAQAVLAEGMQEAFQKGTELIDQSLGNAMEKAAITASKGALVGLTGTTAIDAERALSKADASIQLRAIDVNLNQIFATQKLTNAIELDRLSRDRAKEVDGSEKAIKLDAAIKVSTKVGEALKLGTSGVTAQVKEGAKYRGPTNTDSGSIGSNKSTSEDGQAGQALSGIYAAQQGAVAAKSSILAAQKSEDLANKYKRTMAEVAETTILNLNNEQATTRVKLEQLDIEDRLMGYITDESATTRSRLELSTIKNAAQVEEAVIASKIVGLQLQLNEKMLPEIRNKVEIQKTTETTALLTAQSLNKEKEHNKEREIALSISERQKKSIEDSLKLAKIKLGMEQSSAANLLDIEESNLDVSAASIELLKSKGLVDEEEYINRKGLVNLAKADLAYSRDKVKTANDYNSKLTDINRQLGLTNDPTVTENLVAQAQALNQERDQAIDKLGRQRDATKAAEQAILDLNTPTERISKGIQGMADSMTGAFIDATQTGKYEFTEMASSMLLDIAKVELRMSMMKNLNAAMPNGIMSAIGSLFGGSSGGSSFGVGAQPAGAEFNIATFDAKGNAYESGVQAFAKGGVFSNSVVSSPTLFKFAKGTGMMGEAGPEAIMPLSRDSNGRLGVSGGGSTSNTQVVVNNFSGQQAETKESVDSRGQRRIEITVGNMVAGEIQRSGSAAQQSIKNTFGKQPSLIRR